jgi:hypothetical protein
MWFWFASLWWLKILNFFFIYLLTIWDCWSGSSVKSAWLVSSNHSTTKKKKKSNLFTICTSSFEKYLFISFAHLLIELFVCLVFGLFWVLYILLIMSALSDACLAKTFSHSLGCLFILLIVSFAVQKPFNLILSHLPVLVIISWAVGVLYTYVSKCFSYVFLW